MRTVLGTMMVYAALVLQTALAPHMSISGVVPRFVPLAVYLLTLWLTPQTAILLSASCGLAADSLSSGPLGIEASTCVLLAGLLIFCQRRGWLASPLALCLIPLSVCFETGCGELGRSVLSGRALDFDAIGMFTFASAAYSAGLAMVVYLLAAGVARPAASSGNAVTHLR